MFRVIAATALLTFTQLPSPAVAAEDVKPTVEQTVLTRSFVSLQAGIAHELFCNKVEKEALHDMGNKENAVLMGNQQTLAGRIGGLQKLDHPEAEDDKIIQGLINLSNAARAESIGTFEEKGCDSEEAKAAEKALSFYRKIVPGQLMAFLDEEIEKQGGTVTPPDAFETQKKEQ